MRLVVMGATGMVGSKVAGALRIAGHDVVSASPSNGVNAVTRQGLDEALAGADVVIDVMNAPSFDEATATPFFETACRNLLEAGMYAGVKHHVALSIVGADRLPGSGYFRAKHAQEMLIRSASLPYTIVRSTQFYEFVGHVVEEARDGGVVRLAPALVQPVAAWDVAEIVARIAVGSPRKLVEVAGPMAIRLDAFIAGYLTAIEDPTPVQADGRAPYYGSWINDSSLIPETAPIMGETTFEDWLRSRMSAD